MLHNPTSMTRLFLRFHGLKFSAKKALQGATFGSALYRWTVQCHVEGILTGWHATKEFFQKPPIKVSSMGSKAKTDIKVRSSAAPYVTPSVKIYGCNATVLAITD